MERTRLRCSRPSADFRFHLTSPGYHNISNALATASNAIALLESLSQVSLDEIKQGLEHFDPSPMRMQKFATPDHIYQ